MPTDLLTYLSNEDDSPAVAQRLSNMLGTGLSLEECEDCISELGGLWSAPFTAFCYALTQP